MEQPQALALASEAPTLIRNLASCNKSTRDKSLRLLTTWISSQQEIPDEALKKLWKGLFYSVWHADKSPVQAGLINSLSSLLLTLHLPLSLHYLSVFFLTIRREWPGIDAHRLDKFYLLIRRFMHCFFLLIKNNNWDLELTGTMIGILEEKTFLANDKVLGNGVNYHVASIFLDEFKCFLPVRSEVLEIMFKLFFNVMGKCQDKILVGKIKCNVFDMLLRMGEGLLKRKKLGDDVEDDEMLGFGTIGLTMGFSAKFYELGSSPDCFQGNRKVLFSLHEEFSKLEKDLELSGIQISIPEVDEDEDKDDVPMLIPVVSSETEVSASINKSSKKKKKVKKESDGSNKMTKMRKKDVAADGIGSISDPTKDGNVTDFNKSVVSNLRTQFEKVAAEDGLDKDGSSLFDPPKIATKRTISKKRKRARSFNGQKAQNLELEGDADAKTSEKRAKKVKFSMKNNLVWKPHSPMPSEDLRLPPSVTPRGSALKKGLSPGPVREMPPATKKEKQKKKVRKGIKPIAPTIKRIWKLQALSI